MNANVRAFFALIFFCFSSASAAVIGGPTVDPANGHLYYLLSADTWSASEAEAQALGGNLATVNNAAENAWIFNTFMPASETCGSGLTTATSTTSSPGLTASPSPIRTGTRRSINPTSDPSGGSSSPGAILATVRLP